jgi:ElaB/YqjD/DUF883 family membrane-anchored ribosome-binding protein
MDYADNNTPPQQTAEKSGRMSAVAESILERGTEVYGKARHAVSTAYDKTSDKVSKTCVKAKVYSVENPGKTVLIALGIGAGVGFLLGAKSHRSRTSRIAQPMVNALSDIALAFFR